MTATPTQNNKLVRNIKRALVALLVLTVLWVADSLIAMRAESRIADETREAARLDVSPRIHLGGFPYVASMITQQIPRVTADVMDIEIPGFGMVNASTQANDITVSRQQVLSGDIEGAPAKLIMRTLRLDGVAMGQQLGMTDLDISNPYDISPSGGPAAEVQLIGTPEGFDKPQTVKCKLRIVGDTIHLEPYEVLNGPADREEEILRAFTWQIDTRTLPLPTPANRVYVSGGSIYFESEQRNISLEASDLSPLSSPSKMTQSKDD